MTIINVTMIITVINKRSPMITIAISSGDEDIIVGIAKVRKFERNGKRFYQNQINLC